MIENSGLTDRIQRNTQAAILATFSSARPCERKGHHPPGPIARAAAAALLGPEGREVSVDLARYAELVENLR